MSNKPSLYTSLSPALVHLYDLNNSITVIIDVLRATSLIATAVYNGAKCVIPVDSVSRCIELGKQIEGITAGERDGKIAEGLEYGNSPFEYPRGIYLRKNVSAYNNKWYKAPSYGIGKRSNRNCDRFFSQSFGSM